jgi:ADP-ribose pyrophosphatase YjhB (NUDIX family)
MFHYCPSCASPHVRFEHEEHFICLDCGFEYFRNSAAATGCIIVANEGVVFIERAKEPAKGTLGLPGGFIGLNEGAIAGVRRECVEEIGWDPGTDVRFIASFPNIYLYKGVVYYTCDLYFTVFAPFLQKKDLTLDPSEINRVCFIKQEDIDLDKIGFDATRKAIEVFLQEKSNS